MHIYYFLNIRKHILNGHEKKNRKPPQKVSNQLSEIHLIYIKLTHV
jgi:hypothetical protein